MSNPLNDNFLKFTLLNSQEQAWINQYWSPKINLMISCSVPNTAQDLDILETISKKLQFSYYILGDWSSDFIRFVPRGDRD